MVDSVEMIESQSQQDGAMRVLAPSSVPIDPTQVLSDTEREVFREATCLPAVVLTPGIMSLTGGGFASLALSRMLYWCDGRSVVESGGKPQWLGTYETMGSEIGATKAAMRAAANKLDDAGLICRTRGEDCLLLSPTPVVWLRWQQPSRNQRIHVPTILVLICERDANTAIVLSNLLFWADISKKKDKLATVNGRRAWFMKTTKRLIEETNLSESKLNRSINQLVSLGFIQRAKHKPWRQVRLKRHFLVDFRLLFAAISRWQRDTHGVWSPKEGE